MFMVREKEITYQVGKIIFMVKAIELHTKWKIVNCREFSYTFSSQTVQNNKL